MRRWRRACRCRRCLQRSVRSLPLPHRQPSTVPESRRHQALPHIQAEPVHRCIDLAVQIHVAECRDGHIADRQLCGELLAVRKILCDGRLDAAAEIRCLVGICRRAGHSHICDGSILPLAECTVAADLASAERLDQILRIEGILIMREVERILIRHIVLVSRNDRRNGDRDDIDRADLGACNPDAEEASSKADNNTPTSNDDNA